MVFSIWEWLMMCRCDNLIMKEDYVPYSYQNIVPWILGIFVITAVIPPLVGPLRYTEFK